MQSALDQNEIEAARAGNAKAQHIRQNEERAALRAFVSDPAGRRLLWRWLANGGVYRSSFASDPYTTAYNEGRRAAALQMLGDLAAADPQAYPTMMEEQNG